MTASDADKQIKVVKRDSGVESILSDAVEKRLFSEICENDLDFGEDE